MRWQGRQRLHFGLRCQAHQGQAQAVCHSHTTNIFNGRLRDEFLNVNEFITMHDVREKLQAEVAPQICTAR